MKIVFIGTVEFSYLALETLIEMNAEVVGVVTKSVSKFNSDFYNLTPLCEENNIPYIYYSKDTKEDCEEFIFDKKPDVIYCFGWSHILNRRVFDFPTYGTIGYHPADLPNNRGRHPIIWALFLGLNETASTFFFMDEGADTGDIVSQEKILISDNDTAQTVYTKLKKVAVNQIKRLTIELAENDGKVTRIFQNKNEGNYWRKRGKKDGEIDFRMSSKAIYNLVRALTRPYVGAHINYQGEDIIVWKVEEVPVALDNLEPGLVLENDGNIIVVKCYDNAIKIVDHEFSDLPKKGEYL